MRTTNPNDKERPLPASKHSKPSPGIECRNSGYTDSLGLNRRSNIRRRIAYLGSWDYCETVSRNEYPAAVGGKCYRTPDNQPSAYAELSEAEQDVLQAWIGLCVEPARTTGPSTSYGMKHDFEEVAFHVSNGAFKGAMIVAGYNPVDRDALNWEFRVKPTNRPKRTGTASVLYYDLPEQAEGRERLAALVDKALGRVA